MSPIRNTISITAMKTKAKSIACGILLLSIISNIKTAGRFEITKDAFVIKDMFFLPRIMNKMPDKAQM